MFCENSCGRPCESPSFSSLLGDLFWARCIFGIQRACIDYIFGDLELWYIEKVPRVVYKRARSQLDSTVYF